MSDTLQKNASQTSPGPDLGSRTLHQRSEIPGELPCTADSPATVPRFDGVFTVDVEEYFQVTGFERDIPRRRWASFESRVEAGTYRVLDLLDRHGVHATFFVLGWAARRHPKLVKDIHAAGHEVGSHGYRHRRIYEQTPEQFRRDVRLSRDVLTDIVGERVTSYRAPTFSITKRSLWALEILAQEGFEADCSIFPIHHDRYGIASAEPAPHRIATRAGLIWEFPATTRRVAGLNLPTSGGGYFRLLPVRWTTSSLATACRKTNRPFMFYVHPWELDPDQPRLRAGSWISRRRHYVNLASTERKLDTLLRSFRFGRVDETLSTLQAPEKCRLAESAAAAGEKPGFSEKAGFLRAPEFPPTRRVGQNGSKRAGFVKSPGCASCPFRPWGARNGHTRCRAPVFRIR